MFLARMHTITTQSGHLPYFTVQKRSYYCTLFNILLYTAPATDANFSLKANYAMLGRVHKGELSGVVRSGLLP